jgi:hypothetical protein
MTKAMNKIILLQAFFAFYFQYSFAQSMSVDSLSTNQNDKVHVGIYIMPTFSFNIGKKIVPIFYDVADCNCSVSHYDLKETGNIGYNIGFEVETKKILKKISFSFGMDLEFFRYSGTAEEISQTFWYPYQQYGPVKIEYFYQDYFINVPILVHRLIFINNAKRLKILFGASVGAFLKEKNSSWRSANEYNWFGDKSKSTEFVIAGIDYFLANKLLLNFGLRFTSQINTTPEGRRFASTGLKVGIFF